MTIAIVSEGVGQHREGEMSECASDQAEAIRLGRGRA